MEIVMRIFSLPVAAGAGACNSFYKQYKPETQLTAQQLTRRGFDNVTKSFMVLIVGGGMNAAGFAAGQLAVDTYNPIPTRKTRVLCNASVATIVAAFALSVYGAFKFGEGVADLYQSPPVMQFKPSGSAL
jgi:hypothetical protein